jgi:glutamine amidotransferase
MNSTVAVLDYGMGNLRSVSKALEHAVPGTRVVLTADPDELRRADRVVFPGQGAIAGCVRALDERGLREALIEATQRKPFLGICLGLQALYDFSEEGGGIAGLGLLRGRVPLFPAAKMVDAASGQMLKVPHMGWNQVHQTRDHALWHGIDQDARFYFVHSYYVEPATASQTAATTDYGIRFTSAAAAGNIFAVQFHPEKSQHVGIALLGNFLRWDGES